MQQKISLTHVICLQMGKTTEAKLHQVNLRSPLLIIHYYQSQAITSKKNSSIQYQLTVESLLQYSIGLVL